MLDAGEPWAAYESVVSMRSAMVNYLDWGPHGGAVFVAWADLEDSYDTGKTPVSDAHAALRRAAADWLARPSGPDLAAYIERYVDLCRRRLPLLQSSRRRHSAGLRAPLP